MTAFPFQATAANLPATRYLSPTFISTLTFSTEDTSITSTCHHREILSSYFINTVPASPKPASIMPGENFLVPGFYTEEHYYPGYTEWVEMRKEEAHQRNAAELVRHFYLLTVEQQQCAFTDLPDDVVTRILSHSESTELQVVSALSRRMRQLVSEQQVSANKTAYTQEYGKWELLYPEDPDIWSRAWNGDGSRKSFFDRLKIKEDNALAYFDHVQLHYGGCMNSWAMQELVTKASGIEFCNESRSAESLHTHTLTLGTT